MSDAVKDLKEKLFYEKKNGLLKTNDETNQKIQQYCEGYKDFLNSAKTEREAVKTAVDMAIEKVEMYDYDCILK